MGGQLLLIRLDGGLDLVPYPPQGVLSNVATLQKGCLLGNQAPHHLTHPILPRLLHQLWVDALGCKHVKCRCVLVLWTKQQGQQEFLALALVCFQPPLPPCSDYRNDCAMIGVEEPRQAEPHALKLAHLLCLCQNVIWL